MLRKDTEEVLLCCASLLRVQGSGVDVEHGKVLTVVVVAGAGGGQESQVRVSGWAYRTLGKIPYGVVFVV